MKMKALGAAVAFTLTAAGTAAWAQQVRDEPIKPIQPYVSSNPAKVELGKKPMVEVQLIRLA
mgnify:CR=1 FL=1